MKQGEKGEKQQEMGKEKSLSLPPSVVLLLFVFFHFGGYICERNRLI